MDSRFSRQPPLDAELAAIFRNEKNRRATADHDAYFNSQFAPQQPFYLEPGQASWSEDASRMAVATTGSGVIVSIHDSELAMGAIGYVLLPDGLTDRFPRFDEADPVLLRQAFAPIDECVGLMKRHGAAKSRIRLRLAGGGTLPGDTKDKGTKNYVFVKEYIRRKKLDILNEDLGGPYVRRVHFFPTDGRCVRMILRRDSDFEFARALEAAYQAKILTEN